MPKRLTFSFREFALHGVEHFVVIGISADFPDRFRVRYSLG